MGRTPQDITDKELEVLRALWEQGPLPIRRIAELVYPERRSSYYATVQKLLDRLEAKGFVTRDRSESIHVFAATVQRDDIVGRRLQAVAEQLCDGSWAPLLTHLVQPSKLSEADRAALRRLIDDLDRATRGSRKPGAKDRP
jgi:BlaI family transcriptional regulator, penicillinase repressor